MIMVYGLVFILLIFGFFKIGLMTMDLAMLIILFTMIFLPFLMMQPYINTNINLKLLNDFLVDNRAYLNNRSLKYYDKETEKHSDDVFKKHVDYISGNKIKVSLLTFNSSLICERVINSLKSSSENQSHLLNDRYTIKTDTLIADKSVFCKNKDNKITYTMIVHRNN